MSPIPEVDSFAEDKARLLADCAARRAVRADDVRRLREATYRLGKIDRRFAAELVHANRRIENSPEEWRELVVELLSSFFLDYREGQYGLSEEKEALLLSWLGDNEAIATSEERRLALRVLLKAANAPELLERHVLSAITDNLMHRSERWLGTGERLPGQIDAMDMQLIRSLVERQAGMGSCLVSRTMVSFLLAIEQKALSFADPGGWRRFLIDSILRHFGVEGSADANRDEGWGHVLRADLSTLLGLDCVETGQADGWPDEAKSATERLYQDILFSTQTPRDRSEAT